MIDIIDTVFDYCGWKWKIGPTRRKPTKREIELLLERLSYAIQEGQQIEAGRVLMRYEGGHKDVFIMIGEYDEDSDEE